MMNISGKEETLKCMEEFEIPTTDFMETIEGFTDRSE